MEEKVPTKSYLNYYLHVLSIKRSVGQILPPHPTCTKKKKEKTRKDISGNNFLLLNYHYFLKDKLKERVQRNILPTC